MISFREAEKAGLLVCEGWEGGLSGEPAAGTPCVRAIHYRLRLTYGRAAPPAAARPAGPPGPPGGAS